MREFILKLSAIAGFLLSGSCAALAAPGTPSGTTITNTIALSYKSGGSPITIANAATASFVVDRKVDFLLESITAGKQVAASPGAITPVLTFEVWNIGNDLSAYDLDIESTSTGDVLMWDSNQTPGPGSYTVRVSSSATPGDPSETFYLPTGIVDTPSVLADGRLYFHIYANIPADVANKTEYTFKLTGLAMEPMGGGITVASGTGDLMTVDTIIANGGVNANETETAKIIIQAAELSAAKTVKVVDEGLTGSYNCASGAVPASDTLAAVPGACMLYTITVSNGASADAAASDLVITDILPPELSYVGHDKGDFDTVTWNSGSGTITGSLASLPVSESASFTIRATLGD